MSNVIPFPVNPRSSRADIFRADCAATLYSGAPDSADQSAPLPFRRGDVLRMQRSRERFGHPPRFIDVVVVDVGMRGVYSGAPTYTVRGRDGTMYITMECYLSRPPCAGEQGGQP